MQNETKQPEKSNIDAFCDCCDRHETASPETLNANGWFLGRNEQFCPDCND